MDLPTPETNAGVEIDNVAADMTLEGRLDVPYYVVYSKRSVS